ncbi:endonuclease/exonuclease/phosphatase family protein [Vibrio scophthalmi]|uniref:Metal-dependent hydrolase n=1 Tax=Vibrio scophthalmi LMG 19158 TaxID=870967 RepID=F9RUH7_9VIBR|nr:endonuclease/exonuclease/phosphatase family protein [Vibrio scophthalmi]EGU30246.1 metal-dependent hydrolase [Vibrio scophthalmi LMG 19158]
MKIAFFSLLNLIFCEGLSDMAWLKFYEKSLMNCAVKCHILLYVVVLYAQPTLAQQEIKISTWNMEWLDIKGNKRFKPSLRSNADFSKMSYYFRQIDTPILAFQEVSSKAAIQRVVGENYTIYLSDRSDAKNQHLQFNDINQYTGFAVKNGLSVSDPSDFSLLGDKRRDKLRFASYIVLHDRFKQPVHLLSLHLKARCSGQYKSNDNCKTLKQQGVELNRWILQREQRKQPYIISGDFNHNLAYPNDWLWKEIARYSQAHLSTRNVNADCIVRSRNKPSRTHQFRSLIDHIVVSHHFVIDSAKQDLFARDDILRYQLSDHCPLSITLSAVNSH